MSLEKMNKYKEQRSTRKARVRKENRNKKIASVLVKIVLAACVVAIGAAIGVTIKNQVASYEESQPDYSSVDYMLAEDLAGVLDDDTTAEETTVQSETTAAAETTGETVSESNTETASESDTETIEETVSENDTESAETEEETSSEAETAAETEAETK